MPAGRRRSSSFGHRSARRRLAWDTLDLVTTVLVNGTTANYNLAPNFVAQLGMTVMRTHVRVTPVTSTPAIGDGVTIGLVVARSAEMGDPAPAGAITPNIQDLPWAYWSHFTAAPYLQPGGSNTIELDVRSKRKIPQNNLVYAISLKSGMATSNSWRLTVRTLFALP